MRIAALALVVAGAAPCALGQATFSTGPETFTSTHTFFFEKGVTGELVKGFSIWVDYVGDGGNTWASDTNCMITTPDGQTVSIGGFGSASDLDYDYQGSVSAGPGVYQSGPHLGFIDGGGSDGVYKIKFTQDFGVGFFNDFQVHILRSPAGGNCDVNKQPDQGPFWQPLGPDGTYVYANSFFACTSGPVDELGTWLLSLAGAGQGPDIRFEVWGSLFDNPAFGPDPLNVIASTGTLDLGGTNALKLYTAPTKFSGSLSKGKVYWFVASCVGLAGSPNDWQVGGHTTGGNAGTFWYSNDANGINFDGQNLLPEMAFQVSQAPLGNSGCVGDCNGDGVLNILDFVCFQLEFQAGCP